MKIDMSVHTGVALQKIWSVSDLELDIKMAKTYSNSFRVICAVYTVMKKKQIRVTSEQNDQIWATRACSVNVAYVTNHISARIYHGSD